MSTLIPSGSESEGSLYHDHSSSTSSWESDISVGVIFKDLSVNMVSTSHLKDEDEDEETIQSDTDPRSNTCILSRIFALNNANHPQRISLPRSIWELG